jgi:DNA-binding NtrC family response regulator
MERSMIVSALEKSGWVKARAARSLGLNERLLTYKMNSLGMNGPEGQRHAEAHAARSEGGARENT